MSVGRASDAESLHEARVERLAINFDVDAGDPLETTGVCLVVPMFETRRLHELGVSLDAGSSGHVRDALRRTGKRGQRGESLLLLDVPGAAAERVLLIGCGQRRDIDARRFRKIAVHAARIVLAAGATDILHALALVPVKRRDTAWRVRQLTEALGRERYRFDRLKSSSGTSKGNDSEHQGGDVREPGSAGDKGSMRITYAVADEARADSAREALTEARAVALGTAFARDIGNLPPNYCTPRRLVDEARALAERHVSLDCEVLDEEALSGHGMGALLSVAAGSEEPARLIVLRHKGSQDKSLRPIVLVGKGVTFDSGGLSLKPSGSMENMKYDLCGAAAVLGAMEACASLELSIDVVGVIAAAENMPGRGATRPGDVITTMSGRTVEVLNTDAEGRLVLCDAITWSKRQLTPDVIIDVATLTGACVTALGRHLHGLFSNSQSVSRALVNAGHAAGDAAWPMPMLDDYQESLDSRVADMRNIGGSTAGAITAACFLSRFAEHVRWAHLDVAGTATDGSGKSATGRPVPLLVQYLLERARTL